jgi:hypothetical protein
MGSNADHGQEKIAGALKFSLKMPKVSREARTLAVTNAKPAEFRCPAGLLHRILTNAGALLSCPEGRRRMMHRKQFRPQMHTDAHR